ncbi:hypothetical protein [Streptomyces achromogenes]|uniref:hypothetical protein n=1 Tax=Streptomyces achromogenes TaxID=67255 RepID=UPI0038696983
MSSDTYDTGDSLLFSGRTMVYATVGTHHADGDRPTALGWVSGMGRFGAIFGPWIGGAPAATYSVRPADH